MTREQALTFDCDGIDIAAVERPAEGTARGVVVLVHGLGGQKNSETHLLAVEQLAGLGLASIRFDFPGHGESGGSTETLTIGLGARVLDHVAAQARDRHPDLPLALFGASYGGTCILASSAMWTARAIVTRSPVSDYAAVRARQLGPDGMARWERDGKIDGLISRQRLTPWAFYEESQRMDLFATATQATTPLLIAHGEKDKTVPMADSQRLVDSWAGRVDLVKVSGGDHSLDDPLHTALFVAMGCSWIADHLTN